MARFSKTAGHIKLQDGDAVKVAGVMFKVESLLVETGHGKPNVLVFARYKNEENINVYNMREIEAVRMDNAWVDMTGEPVAL